MPVRSDRCCHRKSQKHVDARPGRRRLPLVRDIRVHDVYPLLLLDEVKLVSEALRALLTLWIAARLLSICTNSCKSCACCNCMLCCNRVMDCPILLACVCRDCS